TLLPACGGQLPPKGNDPVAPPVADAAAEAREGGSAESNVSKEAGPDDAADAGALDDVGWAKPLGIFGAVIDQWVTAAAHDVNGQCCNFDGGYETSCRREELANDLGGDLTRMACIAHLAAQNPAVATWLALVEQALERRAACWRETWCATSDISSAGGCA